MQEEKQTARATVIIPTPLYRQLRASLALRGITFSDWVREKAEKELRGADIVPQ